MRPVWGSTPQQPASGEAGRGGRRQPAGEACGGGRSSTTDDAKAPGGALAGGPSWARLLEARSRADCLEGPLQRPVD